MHHEEGRNPKEVGRLVARRCDVTDEVAVSTLFDTVQAQFGPLDVLVNSAGVASQSSCVDLSLAEWDRVLGTNLTGTFLCSQAALRQMLPAKRGSITSSYALLRVESWRPSVLRARATEVAPHVRVNSVCPGQIVPPMIEDEIQRRISLLGRSREQVEDDWLRHIPLHRFQSTADIANAVAFLASDDAKEITGAALNVSDGLVMD